MTTNEVIAESTIEGTLVRLPPVQLSRNEYLDVKKALELIGGKWKGGLTKAFVFPSDPRPLVEKILAGEKITSAKKEFQFFPTPADLARYLVDLAQPKPGEKILEPSAGQGAIVKAIVDRFRAEHGSTPIVDCYELMDLNSSILAKVDGARIVGSDFLQAAGQWDCIIANPPFAKNQDIDHVAKMWEVLAPGGRIVTIMSPHWTFSRSRKELDFRDFVRRYSTDVEDVPSGAFKESGTGVASVIVQLRKP